MEAILAFAETVQALPTFQTPASFKARSSLSTVATFGAFLPVSMRLTVS